MNLYFWMLFCVWKKMKCLGRSLCKGGPNPLFCGILYILNAKALGSGCIQNVLLEATHWLCAFLRENSRQRKIQ